MKSFKQYITETKMGDCFEVAANTMMDISKEKEPFFKMVHAYVQGQGSLEGRRFAHGFNLISNDVVMDNSNGNKIVMRRKQYYELGKINPKEKGAYKEYNKEETLKSLVQHKHYGPWDLKDSLDEEIPDEKKEIGKKKLRISPKVLQRMKDELE